MKTFDIEFTEDIFSQFSLSAEEMINIRGGEGDPVTRPTDPPVKI